MKLDRDNFRAWLETNRDSVVGLSSSRCNCPIANYVKHLGYEEVIVSSYISIKGFNYKYNWIEMTNWVRTFILSVDKLTRGQYEMKLKPANVTGRQAIEILDGIISY